MALSQWQLLSVQSIYELINGNPPIAHDMNDVQWVKGKPPHWENCPISFPTGVWLLLRPLRFETNERMMKEERPRAYRHRPMTRSS